MLKLKKFDWFVGDDLKTQHEPLETRGKFLIKREKIKNNLVSFLFISIRFDLIEEKTGLGGAEMVQC